MTLEEKDNAYVWHPFTQMKVADPPILIEKAKGCTLYAADGKTYIDAVSSWWVNIHGHANDVIGDRIAQQAKVLEHVIFAGFTHEPAITLAEKLIRILPPHFSKVFFSDDGSTAVEVGVKMALQYWHNQGQTNKTKIIALENAYHGDTFGAMAAGARSAFTQPFHSHLFEVSHIPAPAANAVDESIAQFKRIAASGEVAAFIFEPLVQGSSGMLMHEPKHLDKLLSIAKEYKILCIADEVMTGFGRTGKNFAINYLQNQPDIICLSKGITGGFLPLGVTVSTQEVYNAFYADEVTKTFFHGHSYTANPLACAAANASIELLLDKACQQQIKWITNSHQLYAGRMSTHPFIKNLRCRGTILALELNTGENTSYFNNIRKHAYDFYLKQGVLLRPLGNIIYIMPPYCITKEELDKVYEVITQSLGYLQQKSKEK
jgi:adenosylmethionine-8-amino-7-oxononanoate aminotransferase